MDRESEFLRDDLPDINLKTTAMNEHVPCIERQIRVIKEQMRAVWITLPFTVVPGRVFTKLSYFAVLWLN